MLNIYVNDLFYEIGETRCLCLSKSVCYKFRDLSNMRQENRKNVPRFVKNSNDRNKMRLICIKNTE